MQTELPLFGMASSAVRNPAHFCCAGWENGPTLVIHKIVLEPCGNQSCTERTFTLRITGPSYPNGEIFTLRAGSCTQLDEPLVISGLEPAVMPSKSCSTVRTNTARPSPARSWAMSFS